MLGTANRPPTSESGRGFLPRRDHRTAPRFHAALHAPCRRGSASASPSTPSAHMLRVARGPVPHTVAGALQHRPEQSWPSHWLRCWQVHGRATSEKMASQDSHERPVPPPPPHSRSVAHTSHAPVPHICMKVWHRRAGRTVRPRGREATRWTWIRRSRRARTPTRPCDAPPRPRRPLRCSAHSGAEPTLVLCRA